METVAIETYSFDELSDEAKEIAREAWRRNAEGDTYWSEFVLDDAKEIAAILGISIDHIYFSGFWSQGDGACFTGSYRYAKKSLAKIKSHAPTETELHRIARELQSLQHKNFYSLTAQISHHGHYYHEMSTHIEAERSSYYGVISESAVDALAKLLRDYMRWIYRCLENAWNWENSDEAIDENIGANEMRFTASGEIF